MPIDAQVSSMLRRMDAAGVWDPVALGVDGYRRMLAAIPPLEVGEPVEEVENLQVPAGDHAIPIRVYHPGGASLTPGAFLFFHGGGFVSCGLDTHDGLCRAFCNASGCVVVSVDYRLAPEARFPLPLDDCYAATCWVRDNASRLAVDADRLAVGGDSAGGNLAAAVALLARDRKDGPRLRHQFLLNAALDSACDTPSFSEFAEGYLLTRKMVLWFWDNYLGSPYLQADPLANPARAIDLAGLPPATVVSSEFDPLRDEDESYAARLAAAGVPTTTKRYAGMVHGFLSFPMVDAALAARREIGRWIGQALAP